MHHNGTTFFCVTGHDYAPVCTEMRRDSTSAWPITIKIGDITIFCDEQQLIAFKNSVLNEFENLNKHK